MIVLSNVRAGPSAPPELSAGDLCGTSYPALVDHRPDFIACSLALVKTHAWEYTRMQSHKSQMTLYALTCKTSRARTFMSWIVLVPCRTRG